MSKHDPAPRLGLLAQSQEHAYQNCQPLNATIEITMGCNLACQHCYNFDRSKAMPPEFKNNALSDTEIHGILKDIIKEGAFFINLSGGEALLHPSLDQFIQTIVQEKAIARLKSNGLLLTSKRCSELVQAGLQGVDITLYGMSEESYQIFSRKSAFSQAIQGVKNAQEVGLEVHINFILHKANVHELDLFLTAVNANQWSFAISDEITERYDHSPGALDWKITANQMRDLLAGPHRALFDYRNTDHALQCSCARSVVGISVTGKVFPCIGAPIIAGDLRRDSFSNIWKNSAELTKIRNLKTSDFKSCESCGVIDYCQRSSGAIFCDTGDYTGCSETTISAAKIRSEN